MNVLGAGEEHTVDAECVTVFAVEMKAMESLRMLTVTSEIALFLRWEMCWSGSLETATMRASISEKIWLLMKSVASLDVCGTRCLSGKVLLFGDEGRVSVCQFSWRTLFRGKFGSGCKNSF